MLQILPIQIQFLSIVFVIFDIFLTNHADISFIIPYALFFVIGKNRQRKAFFYTLLNFRKNFCTKTKSVFKQMNTDFVF